MVVDSFSRVFPVVRTRTLAVLLVLIVIIVRDVQVRNVLFLSPSTETLLAHPLNLPPLFQPSPANRTSMMGACLFVRDDNRRLVEWVAYHYITMPLRHLIVGSDINSKEDPMDVLQRWNRTSLTFQVWYSPKIFPPSFRYRYRKDPVKKYIERQSHFNAECMKYFHGQGNMSWVILSDSDEYLKLNPLDDPLNERFFGTSNRHRGQPIKDWKTEPSPAETQTRFVTSFLGPNETWWDRVVARKTLRRTLGLDHDDDPNQNTSTSSLLTVTDVLDDYSSRHVIPPCFAVARLQYSAVMENFASLAAAKCHPPLNADIMASFNISKLTTIRYLYHAKPGDFDYNHWSKVLMDVRRYPTTASFSQMRIRMNPHAPLYDCHRPPFMSDLVSLLRVNHYLNDVSVYTGRKGDPRQKQTSDWSMKAHLRHGVTCDHMHGWLNELVQQFGIEQATELLRLEEDS